MFISARERKMLQLLIDSNETVPIRELAKSLDVSERTIHRGLQGIEQILEVYGLLLQRQAGRGLVVKGDQASRKKLKEAIAAQGTIDYTPEERQVLILSKLLEANEPVKLFSLATELGVTVATISHDLDKMEEQVNEFQLELIRKRGYGVEVKGSESHIREAISLLIMKHMNELDFITLIRENVNDTSLDQVSEQLLGLVSRENISLIETTLASIRSSLHYDLTDHAYIGLVIHIALAIERLQQGEVIIMEAEYLRSLKDSKEFEMAAKVIEKLESTFEIDIPEDETGYITMHLMGAKIRYDTDAIIEDSSLSIAFKAKQLIEFVSKSTQQDLHQSNQLLNDLVVHLKPSVYRIQQQMDIQNPLTEQIEQDYPDLFQTVQSAVAQVFPGLVFPKEETAYIVMHFASAMLNMEGTRGLRVLVVCSSGMGTAKILAAKLQQQFYEIEEVDHRSLFDLEKLEHQQYDLTISTVPMREYTDSVLVNPMLPTKDIHKLQHVIRRVRMDQGMKRARPVSSVSFKRESMEDIQNSIASIQSYAETITEVMKHLAIMHTAAADKEKALLEACQRLKKHNVVYDAPEVVKALLKREKTGGLGIPETKLAIYHTKLREIAKPCFSLIHVEKAIEVQGMDGQSMESDSFIVMLAPDDLSVHGNEVLSYLSSLIVEDEESTKVLESHDEERMRIYFSNKLYQFLQDKLSN
ncbi:BglG family transcription antiterminator [Halobacillus naozhouensis]|uniref:BglG family transcription antiterminator n=1 Tax=Halobacillus naozhouensis TaxID=554880 RepID=A0ABY8J360_9BACI|nr:BglG family transcription antiterminator [Halobacillus naozhouensis]WFT75833.1 BglG family transcription antiterminator [Halobacillus naozhouensis]